MDSKLVVQLTLQNGMNTEGTLYHIKKGWHLHFLIGASLQGQNPRVFTNYPIDQNTPFHRSTYQELEIHNPTCNSLDAFNNYAELNTTHSGAFEFFLTVDGSDKRHHATGEGYFIVDPLFSTSSSGKTWELDGVVLHTYLAKNLGCLPDWWSRLEVSHRSGYNMVHFTPLQELGYSNSCYSLRDHLTVNPTFSPPGGPKVGWKEIGEVISRLEEEWGMLSMADLVYNHAASDGPWLLEHPEATYNLITAPHLRPAYLLDRIIWQLSLDTSRGKYAMDGLPTEIVHEGHLDIVKHVLEQEIAKYDIHAFYKVDVEKQITEFANYLSTPDPSRVATHTPDQIKLEYNRYTRYGASIDVRQAARLVFDLHGDLSRACEDLRRRLCQLNDAAHAEIDDHLRQAVVNVLANGRYRFLDPSGPKVGKVTPGAPIMWE